MHNNHGSAINEVLRKVAMIALVGLFSAFLLANWSTNLERQPITPTTIILPSTPHGKIDLVGNVALTTFANNTGGDGSSWAAAVVIKNYTINAAGSGSCISIQDTTAFLVIQNCTLLNSGGDPEAGIKLVNCTNVNITRCVAINNGIGIHLVNVNASTISRNNMTGSDSEGIKLENSHGNLLVKNRVYNMPAGNGIFVDQSSTTSILNNTCSGASLGIYVSNSQAFTIRFNNVTSCTTAGIELSGASLSEISNNSVVHGGVAGIYIFVSNWVTVRWNNVTDSGNYGILVEGSTHVMVNSNEVTETTATCCSLSNSYHGSVNDNDLTTSDFMDWGIAISYGINYTIHGNTILAKNGGILLGGSTTCDLANNALTDCSLRITASLKVEANSHLIDTSNTVNTKPIYYHANATMLGSGDVAGAGQVILANCNDSTFSGLSIANATTGVLLLYCNNVAIVKSTVESCSSGIKLVQSSWCQVNESSFRHSAGNPIELEWSNNNTIAGNHFEKNNGYSCYVWYSNGNRILGQNNCTDNIGMRFLFANYNVVSNNTFTTFGSPIELSNAKKNTFVLNKLSCNFNPGVAVQFSSHYNTIERNNISTGGAGNGVMVHTSNGTLILSNNITNSGIALALTNANGTTVRGNRVYNNPMGIYLSFCSGCLVYSNNFSTSGGNRATSDRTGASNAWDNGTCGNLWDNYLSRYPTANSINGYWTTPYTIVGTAGEADNHPIAVDLPVTCDFTVNDTSVVQSIQLVQFNFTGTVRNGPANFLWDFGDSMTSTDKDPWHVYFTTGTYNVSLQVTDFDGDTAAEIKNGLVTVVENLFPVPTFSLSSNEIKTGESVQFTYTGTEGNAPATFFWQFGDGGTSTLRNPSHSYNSVGTFTVNLTVTDDNGDRVYSYNQVTVTAASTDNGVPGYSTDWIVLAVVLGIAGIALKLRPIDARKRER